MSCVTCNSKEKFTANDSKHNASLDSGDPLHLSTTEVVIIMTMASATMTANLIVLIASKFTGGGRSPTLVFVRNLCLSDVLVGAYGIFKMIMYLYLNDLIVDFFLPESLFFTASLAYSLSLLCLNVDCFIRLSQPLHYSQHLDKKNMITVMVILWNISFIVGFLPQVGWQDVEFSHRFFLYYSWHYLLFFVIFHTIILLFNCITLIFVKKHINFIKTRRHFMSPSSSNFRHYCHLVVTSLIDVCFLALCYVPFFIYFGFYCSICFHAKDLSGDVNIVYFIPVFLIKSFISAIVHGYRTAQINEVMNGFRRRVSKMVHKSRHRDQTQKKTTSIQSIAYTDSADCTVCDRPFPGQKHSRTNRSTDTQLEIISDSQVTLSDGRTNRSTDTQLEIISDSQVTLSDGRTNRSTDTQLEIISESQVTLSDGPTNRSTDTQLEIISDSQVTLSDGRTNRSTDTQLEIISDSQVTLPDGRTNRSIDTQLEMISDSQVTLSDGHTSNHDSQEVTQL